MTTIVSVRSKGQVAVGGEGQVTLGNTILKHDAVKIRRLYHDKVIVGFAGTSADAFALLERFEGMLEKYSGGLVRSAVELAKLWRTDKALRHLDSVMAVVDQDKSLVLSGRGDVIEPEEGLIGIGSGGPYALAAAQALVKHSELDARGIAEEALRIAARICLYSNANIHVEVL